MQLELRIPPVALWAACAAATGAIARWLNPWSLSIPGHRTVAVVSALAGCVIAIAGVVEFKRHKTTVNPMSPTRASAVVHSGVYRYTRNPMYLGMALALLGVALWWPSAPGLIVVPLFCLYIGRYQIQPEEEALVSLFGEEYTTYMSRVRRWI